MSMSHLHRRTAAPPEDAPRRCHVGVVAARRHADVPLVGRAPVGGVEAHPAQAGKPALHPGVGGRSVGPAAVGSGYVQIARHVAGGDAPGAGDGDHHVGVVLADPPAGFQDLFHRGVDQRGARGVVERFVQGVGQRQQVRQRVAVRLDAQPVRKGGQGGGGGGARARTGEVPVGPGVDRRAQLAPGAPAQGFRQLRGGRRLDGRPGRHLEGRVLGADGQEVPGVAERVLLGAGRGGGRRGHLEGGQPLAPVVARRQVEVHGAVDHRVGVEEAGGVLDAVEGGAVHGQRPGAPSIG